MRRPGLSRAALLVAAVAVTALGAGPDAASAQESGCDDTAVAAGAAAEAQVRAALRCLVNATRQHRGLRSLRPSGRLNVAADGHSADMVARRYFAHVTPEGASVSDRVRQTGYMRASADWALGEDIGWGTGTLSSPAAVFRTWMDSPPHRRVILDPDFRDVGIGVAPGVPVAGEDAGATFVLDVGETG